MKRRPRRACRRCRLAESVTNGGGARAEGSQRLGFLFGGIWLCFRQRRSNEGASRRRLRFVGPMTGTTALDQATARVYMNKRKGIFSPFVLCRADRNGGGDVPLSARPGFEPAGNSNLLQLRPKPNSTHQACQHLTHFAIAQILGFGLQSLESSKDLGRL
ncbi:hypothetical protein V6N13_111091 [Hibiscus sabdariffa]